MIWLLVPLGWVLASITVAIGVNGFLRAEASYMKMLEHASDHARQRVERESRVPEEVAREQAMFAAQAAAMADFSNAFPQASGLAWAQMNAMQSQNAFTNFNRYQSANRANRYGGQLGMLGGLFG